MWITAFALLTAAEPVPTGEISQIFRPDDYPTEALKRNETGTVAVEAEVRPDGRVTACRITQSSGSALLDTATCTVIATRGRFVERAKQHGGKAFTISTQVTWDAKPAGIPLVAHALKVIYTTDEGVTCRIESPLWMIMEGACEASQANAEANIAQISKGRSVAGLEYVLEMASIPGDHLTDNGVGEGRGEELLGRQTALLTLAADGRVTGCVGGEDTLAGDLPIWCDSFVKNERYVPLPASAENQSERQLTKIQAIYLRSAAPR